MSENFEMFGFEFTKEGVVKEVDGFPEKSIPQLEKDSFKRIDGGKFIQVNDLSSEEGLVDTSMYSISPDLIGNVTKGRNGSVITLDLQLKAGDKIEFWWSFVASKDFGNPKFNDFALFVPEPRNNNNELSRQVFLSDVLTLAHNHEDFKRYTRFQKTTWPNGNVAFSGKVKWVSSNGESLFDSTQTEASQGAKVNPSVLLIKDIYLLT